MSTSVVKQAGRMLNYLKKNKIQRIELHFYLKLLVKFIRYQVVLYFAIYYSLFKYLRDNCTF